MRMAMLPHVVFAGSVRQAMDRGMEPRACTELVLSLNMEREAGLRSWSCWSSLRSLGF